MSYVGGPIPAKWKRRDGRPRYPGLGDLPWRERRVGIRWLLETGRARWLPFHPRVQRPLDLPIHPDDVDEEELRLILAPYRFQPVHRPELMKMKPRELWRWLKKHPVAGGAIQDDASALYGGARTWISSGGTFAITCTSLASAGLRQGAKSSSFILVPSGLSTAILPDYFEEIFYYKPTSQPAAGGEVGSYWGFSDQSSAGLNNPGGLSGTDAAGTNVDTLGQLTFAGAIVLSANIGGGTGTQLGRFTMRPLDQYVSPEVYNNGSVAFDATALDTFIQLTPCFRVRST
jgi:hypothetical protein